MHTLHTSKMTCTSISAQCLKRKTSTDEDAGRACKRFRATLEPSSDSNSSFDLESVYSWQNHETASARDTEDTEEHEYSPKSLSSEVSCSEVSSSPETFIAKYTVAKHNTSSCDQADVSDETDERTIKITLPKTCLKCRCVSDWPYSFCIKCHRRRKAFWPPRPNRKEKTSPLHRVDAFEMENLTRRCKCCEQSPRNGAFVHGSSYHSEYCYHCSVTVWKSRGTCPFCNLRIDKVLIALSVL